MRRDAEQQIRLPSSRAGEALSSLLVELYRNREWRKKLATDVRTRIRLWMPEATINGTVAAVS